MTVSINTSRKKVIGLYGLTTTHFEGSLYEAETDAAKLLAALKLARESGRHFGS